MSKSLNRSSQAAKAETALKKMGVTILGLAWDEEDGRKVSGNGGYFCKVPFSKIKFADYQRKITRSHAEKIRSKFDIRACQPLSLSYRDGELWCYDGRHRMKAMMDEGYSSHRAIVITGLTYEDEAKLFYFLNDMPKKMASWTKFEAQLKAGYDANKQILDTIHANGLTTPLHETIDKPDRADITSCSAVKEAFDSGGLPGLNTVCRVLNEAWRMPPTTHKGKRVSKGGVDPIAKRIDILRGLISFLKDYPELPENTIVMVLQSPAFQPENIQAIAKRKKSKGRIDSNQYKQAFVEVFLKRSKAA